MGTPRKMLAERSRSVSEDNGVTGPLKAVQLTLRDHGLLHPPLHQDPGFSVLSSMDVEHAPENHASTTTSDETTLVVSCSPPPPESPAGRKERTDHMDVDLVAQQPESTNLPCEAPPLAALPPPLTLAALPAASATVTPVAQANDVVLSAEQTNSTSSPPSGKPDDTDANPGTSVPSQHNEHSQTEAAVPAPSDKPTNMLIPNAARTGDSKSSKRRRKKDDGESESTPAQTVARLAPQSAASDAPGPAPTQLADSSQPGPSEPKQQDAAAAGPNKARKRRRKKKGDGDGDAEAAEQPVILFPYTALLEPGTSAEHRCVCSLCCQPYTHFLSLLISCFRAAICPVPSGF
jgi:hypothetical protein